MTPLSPTRSSPRHKNKTQGSEPLDATTSGGPKFPDLQTSAAVAPSSSLTPSARPPSTANRPASRPTPKALPKANGRGRGPGGRTAPDTGKRGRGRPLGGALPANSPMNPTGPNKSHNIHALVAAAETITSESKYASFLKGDIKFNKYLKLQEKMDKNKAPPVPQAPEGPAWTHPALNDDNSLDSEYAKFVRGLVDDDQSLFTFKTLQSVKDVEPAPDVVGTIVGDDIAYSVMDNTLDDGDDEDYQLTSDEEDEEDDDEKSAKDDKMFGTPKKEEFDLDNHLFGEIEGLLEEDLDAQLTSLLQTEILNENKYIEKAHVTPGKIAVAGTEQQKAITSPGQSTKKKKSTQTVVTTPPLWSPDVATTATTAQVTRQQLQRLRETMAKHHQLLLQQATLAVRAAYVHRVGRDVVNRSPMSRQAANGASGALPASMLNSRQLTFCAPGFNGRECSYENDFYHGENPDELAECLDGAVGMLQDLEQNWKDAVRNSIQLSYRGKFAGPSAQQGGRRNLLSAISEKTETLHDTKMVPDNGQESNNSSERRLTRSAFTKTLLEREMGMNDLQNEGESSMLSSGVSAFRHRISVFDIRGLARLRETFSAIDNSVKEVRMEEMKEGEGAGINILHPSDHGNACELLLRHAGAEVDEQLVPGKTDLCELFTHTPEAFAEPEKVNTVLTKAQRLELRRNKNQFTAGEDNLILRGVNLYGEKEWVLVSDRFLPDRPVNNISQRYHRLCFLIYKSNGVFIDDEGKLAPLPAFKKGSVVSEDEAATRTQEAILKIKPPAAPTTMNVHRWTMEEDVAILKAVPMMGNQWAEICNHIIPHRDRGHIRKRYQVLERRIPKGTTKMNLKRPATGELGREVAKYAKTAVLPKTQKSLSAQKKALPKKSFNGVPSNARAKTPKISAAAKGKNACLDPKTATHASSFQPYADRPDSSFDVSIDEDDEKGAALLHRLSTPQRSRQEQRLSQDSINRDAAKDLEYILNGEDNSNAGGETTRLGLEKILANDWSQESGMQRLLDAGVADESKPFHSPIKSNQLPDITMGDVDASRLSMLNEFNATEDDQKGTYSVMHSARRSLLSTAIQKTEESASKRNNTEAPREQSVKVSGSPVKVNLGSYVSSSPIRSPAQSPTQDNIFSEPFTLAAAYGHLTPRMIGTPGKIDTPGIGEKSHSEAFQYFMSDGSPLKSMTPSSKLLPPNTPLTHLGFNGGLSGPIDAGNNSLFMAGDDFDCASALQDLSNSAPTTPSKLLLPTRISQTSGKTQNEPNKKAEVQSKTSFLSKVKAQVGLTKKKVS